MSIDILAEMDASGAKEGREFPEYPSARLVDQKDSYLKGLVKNRKDFLSKQDGKPRLVLEIVLEKANCPFSKKGKKDADGVQGYEPTSANTGDIVALVCTAELQRKFADVTVGDVVGLIYRGKKAKKTPRGVVQSHTWDTRITKGQVTVTTSDGDAEPAPF